MKPEVCHVLTFILCQTPVIYIALLLQYLPAQVFALCDQLCSSLFLRS